MPKEDMARRAKIIQIRNPMVVVKIEVAHQIVRLHDRDFLYLEQMVGRTSSRRFF